MVYKIGSDLKGIAVPNFHFKTVEGIYAFCVNAPEMQKAESGVYIARCHIPENMLNDGIYTIGLAITEYLAKGYIVHFFEEHYLTLNVIEQIHDNSRRYDYGGPVPGVIRPLLKWEVKQKERF
jgi:lipopolysaccharide transport system ATP-binding protein